MLVSCYAYQDGKRIAEIKPDDISEYISRPECFVWVALKEPGPGELAAMQHEFGLHELAVEDARHGHQRPKIEEYGDSLFAVLHIVEIVDGELTVGEFDIFAGPNYVLSVRSHAEKGFIDVRARCEREPRAAAPRFGIRAVRVDGRGGGPLFPADRRAGNGTRTPGGAHVRRRLDARQHRGACTRSSRS